MAGSILHLASYLKPEISYAAHALCRRCQDWQKEDWTAAKRVLKYLNTHAKDSLTYRSSTKQNSNRSSSPKENDRKLDTQMRTPRKTGKSNQKNAKPHGKDTNTFKDYRIELVGYSDSDFGMNPTDRKSLSAIIIQLNGNTIHWRCNKQTIVATSVFEAEIIASQAAVKELLAIENFIQDMGLKLTRKSLLKMDNQASLRDLKHQFFRKRGRHMSIKYHFAKDTITSKRMHAEHVRTISPIYCQNQWTPIRSKDSRSAS